MIRVDVELKCPVEEAFDYFSDFRNENEWNVVAHDVAMTTPAPVGQGSRFRGEYDRMGTLEYEILSYERPRHLRVHGRSRAFEFFSTFDFSTTASGTLVQGTMDPHPKGAMKLLTPLMGVMVKSQITKGMASLKRTVEGRPRPGAAHATPGG